MILIAENGKLQISDILCHPFGLLPWALASDDRSIRKNNKAALANELKKRVRPAHTIPKPCTRIIDGMAVVQKLKGDHKTFPKIADTIMSMTLNEGHDSERIDVLFDVYREESIQNAEREKRGSYTGHEYKSIKADHRIHQWRNFLTSSSNKTQLIQFLSEERQKGKIQRETYWKEAVRYRK